MNTKFKSYYNSPLGKIIIVADNASVCGVYFDNQKYMPENLEDYEINDNILAIKEVKNWLDEYFEGKNPSVKNLSIKLIGIVFDDDEVISYSNKGEPIVLNEKNPASQGYRNIARRLEGETVPLMTIRETEKGGFMKKFISWFKK